MPRIIHQVIGIRKPKGSTVISRTSKWKNPFVVEKTGPRQWCIVIHKSNPRSEELLEIACYVAPQYYPSEEEAYQAAQDCYDALINSKPNPVGKQTIMEELAGRDLVCDCRHPQHCHGKILLKVANT